VDGRRSAKDQQVEVMTIFDSCTPQSEVLSGDEESPE